MTQFPDEKIHAFLVAQMIEARDFILDSINQETAESNILKDRGYHWIYRFHVPGSKNLIEAWLQWPEERISIFIMKDGSKSSFSFKDYMTFIGKKSEFDSLLDHRIHSNQADADSFYVLESIRAFLHCLDQDSSLASIVEGKKWIDVPFDWDGYK